MIKMAYVYRHIRLDTGKPFYIGVGKDENGKYSRAHSHQNRNNHWYGVVKKHGYEVEVLIDGLTYEQAIEKEFEFIALYKRVLDGGTLVNLSLGGGGTLGVYPSDETRLKQSLAKKGRPSPLKGIPATPEKVQHLKQFCFKKGQESWVKGKKMPPGMAEKCSKIKKAFYADKPGPRTGKKNSEESLRKMRETKAKNPQKAWNKGKRPSNETIAKIMATRNFKVVYQLDLNRKLIKEWPSVSEAARDMHIRKGHISNCCLGRLNTYKGFIWSYSKPETG